MVSCRHHSLGIFQIMQAYGSRNGVGDMKKRPIERLVFSWTEMLAVCLLLGMDGLELSGKVYFHPSRAYSVRLDCGPDCIQYILEKFKFHCSLCHFSLSGLSAETPHFSIHYSSLGQPLSPALPLLPPHTLNLPKPLTVH